MTNKSSTPAQAAIPAPTETSIRTTIAASAIAGMIARIPMHPIDTCKAKLQVQTPGHILYQNTWDCAKKTWHAEGVRGLYRGFGTTFFGSAPACALYLTSYETSKHMLTRISGEDSMITHFMSGLIAEGFSCIMWVPIDIVKERLQVQSNLASHVVNTSTATPTATATPTTSATSANHAHAHPRSQTSASTPHAAGTSTSHPTRLAYKGNIDAAVTIWRTEGLRGIYKGYFATLMSFGPFSAIYLSGYEQFKLLFARVYKVSSVSELPFPCFWLSGAAAGGLASFITNPLDMAKLRIQVQRGNMAYTYNYAHIFDGVYQIGSREGLRGLFAGAGARMAFHVPSTAITIGIFDTLKQYISRLDE